MSTADFGRLLLLGALWGASFLFIRIAVPEMGVIWLVGVRVVSGALFLFITALLLKKSWQLGGSGKHLLVLGLLNTALPFLLFSYGATALSASLLSIINSTAPLWGVVIGALLTRQFPAGRVLLGLLAGSSGVALLVLKAPTALAADSLLPLLATLAAPLSYGIASHYARVHTAGLPSFSIAHGSMWGAAAWSLPVLIFAPLPDVAPSAGTWSAALALGIACTGVAYLLYFRLIRDIGAASALTVTFLIPLFGILWGTLFLGELFTGVMAIGGVLVLSGTGLVTGFNPLQLLKRLRV